MRIRRVGSITCGILMIVFGGLFLVHMFCPALSLELIMKLWPLILIALGCEMLISNIRKGEDQEEVLKYDKGAIFLVFLLTCFSVAMGMIEWFVSYAGYVESIYY